MNCRTCDMIIFLPRANKIMMYHVRFSLMSFIWIEINLVFAIYWYLSGLVGVSLDEVVWNFNVLELIKRNRNAPVILFWHILLFPVVLFHCMMTSSNGYILIVTLPLCGKPTGHRWIPRTKARDAELWCFLWSAPWIDASVNNREPGYLRRHRAHYVAILIRPPHQP